MEIPLAEMMVRPFAGWVVELVLTNLVLAVFWGIVFYFAIRLALGYLADVGYVTEPHDNSIVAIAAALTITKRVLSLVAES